MSHLELPLIKEANSLGHREPEVPIFRDKTSTRNVDMIDEDAIPYAHLVPDSPPLVKRVRRRGCRKGKLPVQAKKSEKPKSKTDGIKNKEVRDWIIAAEKRMKQREEDRANDEKPNETATKTQSHTELATVVGMTTGEIDEFLKAHPFGFKEETHDWFADW